MPVIVHSNWIYYFHIVYQHLILATVHVKSHLLFFVFKYLLIFSHFLHQAFHCLVFRLYINSILFKHAHSTLFLPFLLFFINRIFGFRDLRCRLTFLQFLLSDRLISKSPFRIILLFRYFYVSIHSDLFQIIFFSLLFLELIFGFNSSSFRYQFFSLIPLALSLSIFLFLLHWFHNFFVTIIN